jgi:hypothetical protein
MATYAEQIAQWRQQRAQQQVNNRLQEIRQEHAQVVRERDQAIAANDMETAEFRDQDCQQLEQEWYQYNPPRQQVHPEWQSWLRRNQNFIERSGQAGVNAVTGALGYMQRRRTDSTNPAHTGMGMTPQQIFSKQGLDKLDDLLELHGPQFYGVTFDKNEQALTPNGARDASGLDTKSYNAAYYQLRAQGRVK